MTAERPVALVTGASSGIGAASARALAGAGFEVVPAARRFDRLEALAAEIGGRPLALDVTDERAVEAAAASIERLDLLVNNAGGAFGLERVDSLDEADWRGMFELNVLAVARLTRCFLPHLRRSTHGQIINIGSTSGFEVYPGGAGYTASKHGLRALTRTLRLELLGSGVKVTEICPALTETEFALVRFGGDAERARRVYAGMTPLSADDIARCVVFAATQPPHASVDELVIRPLDQADSTTIHRRRTDDVS
jgi:NADP-dependent 3-hydroxy acid dehydrogenase YdfG